MFLGIFSVIPYLRQYTDSKGARRNKRMPVRIPVLYCFQKRKEDFRESFSVDLSASGIQIELIDPVETIHEKFVQRGSPVRLKIDVPGGRYLEEIAGVVRWHKVLHASKPSRYLVGIRFNRISLDQKIELVSYALRQVFMRRMKVVGIAFMAAVLIFGSISALSIYMQKKEMRKDLVYSEVLRQNLEKEINRLANERKQMKRQLLITEVKLKNKLSKMTNILSQKERELMAKDADVTDAISLARQKEEELKKLREQRSLAEEQGIEEFSVPQVFPKNVVTYEKEIAVDPLAITAKKEMAKKRYSNAEQYYTKLVEKYPDSLFATRLLFQALKKQGKQEEADRVYIDFSMKLLQKK